jgi:hypothetical protein
MEDETMPRIILRQADYEILARTVLDFMPQSNSDDAEWEPLDRESAEVVRMALQTDHPPVFGTIDLNLQNGAMQTLHMLWDVASETEANCLAFDDETWKRINDAFPAF